jgi:hypothetical protein
VTFITHIFRFISSAEICETIADINRFMLRNLLSDNIKNMRIDIFNKEGHRD